MTATYILIVFLHYGQAAFTAEFYSKEKCEIAGHLAASMYPLGAWRCVEK
jgi:hypothetical protein